MRENNFFVISTVCILALATSRCSNDTMGFSETFRADDLVTNSIFKKDSRAQGTGTGDEVSGEFRLTVVSDGVSSGFVKLNDSDIMDPSDFHNDSFEKTIEVNLFEENTIEVEIRGQPGDQLCVRVFEIENDESERGIFEQCVDRTAGPPNNVSVVISPTPTPTPTP
ncbi:MAG TPA: hypothetical protein VI895_01170 [Bdellovibrionota bacterium]|nr:hypothetical protein [Bdellovibrionota bacterium]